MKGKRNAAVIGLLLACAGFFSCGGGGAKVQTQITTTSLGQELTDLDAAYKAGVINQNEYENAKKGLIKRFK